MSNNPTNNDDLINAVKKNDLNEVKERVRARGNGILSEIEGEISNYKAEMGPKVEILLRASPWEGEEKEEDNERVIKSVTDSIVNNTADVYRKELVKFHIKGYVNARDMDGNTPLGIAESRGYREIVEFLRDQGATR